MFWFTNTPFLNPFLAEVYIVSSEQVCHILYDLTCIIGFFFFWIYKWPRYCRGPTVKANKQPNLAIAQKLIWQTLGAE